MTKKKENRFMKMGDKGKAIISSEPNEVVIEESAEYLTTFESEPNEVLREESAEYLTDSESDSNDDIAATTAISNKNNAVQDIQTKPLSKILIPKIETIKMAKLGTSIRNDLKKDLDKLAKQYNRKTNNIVNLLLENLYDEKTKNFNIDIDKKESFKITSYHIKDEHYKAIEKLCKASGYNKSEIFNMLIEKSLKNIE